MFLVILLNDFLQVVENKIGAGLVMSYAEDNKITKYSALNVMLSTLLTFGRYHLYAFFLKD